MGPGKQLKKAGRTAETPEKNSCLSVCPAAFRQFHRHFARDPLGTFFGCFSADFNVGHLKMDGGMNVLTTKIRNAQLGGFEKLSSKIFTVSIQKDTRPFYKILIFDQLPKLQIQFSSEERQLSRSDWFHSLRAWLPALQGLIVGKHLETLCPSLSSRHPVDQTRATCRRTREGDRP